MRRIGKKINRPWKLKAGEKTAQNEFLLDRTTTNTTTKKSIKPNTHGNSTKKWERLLTHQMRECRKQEMLQGDTEDT